jgi:hypothetical protein
MILNVPKEGGIEKAGFVPPARIRQNVIGAGRSFAWRLQGRGNLCSRRAWMEDPMEMDACKRGRTLPAFAEGNGTEEGQTRGEEVDVRRRIMRWIDAGRYAEAAGAAQKEGDEELREEVTRQINAKRISVSAAKRLLHHPEALSLPDGAWALGRKGEVVIAIDRRRIECGRWAVSPFGNAVPLPISKRSWREEGGVLFSPLAGRILNGPCRSSRAAGGWRQQPVAVCPPPEPPAGAQAGSADGS